MKLKKSFIIIWLTIIFSSIACLFCHDTFAYTLATPVPENYKMVNCGDKIVSPQIAQLKNNSPLFRTGMNDYIPRPVKLEDVTNKFKEWSLTTMTV